MRLVRYLSENTNLSRKEAKRALHRESVTVDGLVAKKGDIKITEHVVCYEGKVVNVRGPLYLMVHKPKGYVCSTVDDDGTSILELLPVEMRNNIHIAGRLDKDTTGLVLLTDDGQWSHRVTSPNRECKKVYQVELLEALNEALVAQFAAGIELNGENKLTKPAQLTLVSAHKASLTLSEGKYHQVKRMFAAVDNHVIRLHRAAVGPLVLDDSLPSGQWRILTNDEINYF